MQPFRHPLVIDHSNWMTCCQSSGHRQRLKKKLRSVTVQCRRTACRTQNVVCWPFIGGPWQSAARLTEQLYLNRRVERGTGAKKKGGAARALGSWSWGDARCCSLS